MELRRTFKIGLLILPMILLLGFAVYTAWIAWHLGDTAEMGGAAIIAMVLGVIFTLALTAALVGLLIFSERHGYDQ